jgi:hypothetical protein
MLNFHELPCLPAQVTVETAVVEYQARAQDELVYVIA